MTNFNHIITKTGLNVFLKKYRAVLCTRNPKHVLRWKFFDILQENTTTDQHNALLKHTMMNTTNIKYTKNTLVYLMF